MAPLCHSRGRVSPVGGGHGLHERVGGPGYGRWSMGDVVAFRQRDPYLRDIETMLSMTVPEIGSCEVQYACRDRQSAGVLSRRLRGEVKRRGWPATVRQFR